MLTFDGSTRISAWGGGTATVTFKDTAADALTVPPGATGRLAGISRGGLNVHLNDLRNSYGNGADLYQSVIRIVNNGAVSGSVEVTVYDTSDGSMVGVDGDRRGVARRDGMSCVTLVEATFCFDTRTGSVQSYGVTLLKPLGEAETAEKSFETGTRSRHRSKCRRNGIGPRAGCQTHDEGAF